MKTKNVGSVALSLILLAAAGGCATARQTLLEHQYREAAIGRVAYSQPDDAIWKEVTALLKSEGYFWQASAWRDSVLRTDWRCRGDRCDSLVVSLSNSGSERRVVASRTGYDTDADMKVPSTDRAYDIEWALLRRLDPDHARELESSTRVAAAREAEGSRSDPQLP
jgi:hypothetical protein